MLLLAAKTAGVDLFIINVNENLMMPVYLPIPFLNFAFLYKQIALSQQTHKQTFAI